MRNKGIDTVKEEGVKAFATLEVLDLSLNSNFPVDNLGKLQLF